MYICVITRLVSTHFSKGILMNRLLSDCTSCFRPGGGDDKNRQGPVQIQICHFVNRDTHSRQIKIVKINQNKGAIRIKWAKAHLRHAAITFVCSLRDCVGTLNFCLSRAESRISRRLCGNLHIVDSKLSDNPYLRD